MRLASRSCLSSTNSSSSITSSSDVDCRPCANHVDCTHYTPHSIRYFNALFIIFITFHFLRHQNYFHGSSMHAVLLCSSIDYWVPNIRTPILKNSLTTMHCRCIIWCINTYMSSHTIFFSLSKLESSEIRALVLLMAFVAATCTIARSISLCHRINMSGNNQYEYLSHIGCYWICRVFSHSIPSTCRSVPEFKWEKRVSWDKNARVGCLQCLF